MFPKLARISNEHHVSTVEVESKGYIMVRIAKKLQGPTLYWHMVDTAFSLLELGFEWPSGRLVACSVPLFNGEPEDVKSAPGVESGTSGTPYFDLAMWTSLVVDNKAVSGNVLNQPGRIRLQRSPNALSIIVKDVPSVRSLVYADGLVCHFDYLDELTAITLPGTFLGR